ncbi:MAG: DUF2961 domain-containing protein [Phycisphaerae bacterium]|jgi:hypothetical protein
MPITLKPLPFLMLGACACTWGRSGRDATEPPVIPVGLDAFSMWDRWAHLRIGQRTYMASTYDRRGGNESADASHFLYQLADDRNVTLDVTGPGVLAFVRTNHWHGSPWHYVVDGRDCVVQESSSANPEKPVENSVFLPEPAFPNPLTWTWSQTRGADLTWVPIPFERSFLLAYERTRYGTGYYIYHRFAPGTKHLSRPIRSWTPDDAPPRAVLDLINRSGTDLTPPHVFHSVDAVGTGVDVPAGGTLQLVRLEDAPAVVRALKFDVAQEQAAAFGKGWLQIYWDDAPNPSVAAPVQLLFGTGSLFNRENREYLVKAFPVGVRFHAGRVHFAMYFPMPFMKSARVEFVEKTNTPISGLRYQVRTDPYAGPPNHVGYFHATYVDHGTPEPGRDLVFLDTTRVEGGGDWCGHFVGTSFIFSDRAVLRTLEGDPRFYFDDALTPSGQGTGTEEWGGGGDYWGGRTMTLPFAGHPVGCRKPEEALNEEDKIQSAYRFLLSDLMPFGKNARITFEHGGRNDSTEHYQSVTYWYGLNAPCLVLTDSLHVGDEADEARHRYESPDASPVQRLSSRYEWGVDALDGKEIYPPSEDTGRFTTGTSTFTMKLEPRNLGVMLRRKFDYAFPNQCAMVSVADDRPGGPWHEVGLWYTAGSNTCVYSDPKGELGATLHNVQTSNRRWRESEFLLPRELTEGRSSIRVRVAFQPRNIPLFPGHPLAEQAWSEYRYWAYCYVMPRTR